MWAIIITERITPRVPLLTRETRTADKTGRSDIHILPIAKNQIRNEGGKQLVRIGLPKAFDSVDRNILRSTIYGKVHVETN